MTNSHVGYLPVSPSPQSSLDFGACIELGRAPGILDLRVGTTANANEVGRMI